MTSNEHKSKVIMLVLQRRCALFKPLQLTLRPISPAALIDDSDLESFPRPDPKYNETILASHSYPLSKAMPPKSKMPAAFPASSSSKRTASKVATSTSSPFAPTRSASSSIISDSLSPRGLI